MTSSDFTDDAQSLQDLNLAIRNILANPGSGHGFVDQETGQPIRAVFIPSASNSETAGRNFTFQDQGANAIGTARYITNGGLTTLEYPYLQALLEWAKIGKTGLTGNSPNIGAGGDDKFYGLFEDANLQVGRRGGSNLIEALGGAQQRMQVELPYNITANEIAAAAAALYARSDILECIKHFEAQTHSDALGCIQYFEAQSEGSGIKWGFTTRKASPDAAPQDYVTMEIPPTPEATGTARRILTAYQGKVERTQQGTATTPTIATITVPSSEIMAVIKEYELAKTGQVKHYGIKWDFTTIQENPGERPLVYITMELPKTRPDATKRIASAILSPYQGKIKPIKQTAATTVAAILVSPAEISRSLENHGLADVAKIERIDYSEYGIVNRNNPGTPIKFPGAEQGGIRTQRLDILAKGFFDEMLKVAQFGGELIPVRLDPNNLTKHIQPDQWTGDEIRSFDLALAKVRQGADVELTRIRQRMTNSQLDLDAFARASQGNYLLTKYPNPARPDAGSAPASAPRHG